MGTWIDFKELRAKIRFVDVLAHFHVEVKVKGEKAIGFCPLPGHPRKQDGKRHTPSLSVHLTRNIFHCFSCHASGNAIDFFCLMSGGNPDDPASFRGAALKLQQALGMETPKASGRPPAPAHERKSPASMPPAEPETPERIIVNAPLDFELKHLDPTHSYLVSRGFTPETISHFELGFCSKGMMANRVAIPIHNLEGQLVGYAGRLVDDSKVDADNPKYLLPGTRDRNGVRYEFRKSELLYNVHRIEPPVDDLIIVEGFPSIWWLWQCGLHPAAALIGSSCSSEQAQLICQLVPSTGRVWIFCDGDAAGEKCAHSIFSHVSVHRPCRWVQLAQGQQPTDCTADQLLHFFPGLLVPRKEVLHASHSERFD